MIKFTEERFEKIMIFVGAIVGMIIGFHSAGVDGAIVGLIAGVWVFIIIAVLLASKNF